MNLSRILISVVPSIHVTELRISTFGTRRVPGRSMSTGSDKSKTEERKIYTNRHGEEVCDSLYFTLGLFLSYLSNSLLRRFSFANRTSHQDTNSFLLVTLGLLDAAGISRKRLTKRSMPVM